MKNLIIYTHFNPGSFTRGIVDRITELLEKKGEEVRIVDLYRDNFDPVLKNQDIAYSFKGGESPSDLPEYQSLIKWADHLVFVYPLWWSQMPAILKGFIDRVFTMGFAFRYTEKGFEGLLNGKTTHLIINTNVTNEFYKENGTHDAHRQVTEEGIFNHCGMKTETTFFGNIIKSTEEERREYLESVDKLYA